MIHMETHTPQTSMKLEPHMMRRFERKRRREELRAPNERPTVMPDLELSAEEISPENPLEQQYRKLLQDYSSLKKELEAVQENCKLKDQLKKSKFGFFTGLRSAQVFLWLLAILKRSTTTTLRGGLTWENHLLLVLMKIRLGLSDNDVAYCFDLPFSTVSKIVREWIPLLSSMLKPLVIWPSKEAVRANLPRTFKPKFKNCGCIIDCTEIFIERTRAET